MNVQEAIHNFQVIAEKYQGPLSHHQAIGQSISVLRAFIEEHTPKAFPVESSAGGSEVEMAAEAFADVSAKPTKVKKPTKKAGRKK
jgi:hypothetical protein